MDRELVRRMMNRKLGRFLYSARVRSQLSIEDVAAAVGWPVERVVEIEKVPAEVPCKHLYRLITHYGPERAAEAQFVMLDAQAAIRRGRWPITFTISLPHWSPFEIVRGAFKFTVGMALYELAKEAIKTFILGRIS